MPLRDYQEVAVQKMLNDASKKGNSVLCLGTAAGKSHLIAEYAKRLNLPILILCPNREILTQNKEKLALVVNPLDIGVFSASLNEKTIKKYTFATIGSIYRKPDLFSHFSTCIVDECHVVRPDQPNSMYMRFFRANSFPKTFGFTASPYINVTETHFVSSENRVRTFDSVTKIQLITRMNNSFWNRFIFNYDSKMLEDGQHTVKVIYHTHNLVNPDRIRLVSNGSDYDQDDFARKVRMYEDKIIEYCMYSMEHHTSTLVFCANVAQAESLQSKMPIFSSVVTAATPPKERARIIEDFKKGHILVLFNVSCLTTGFDSPITDSIICLRPTKSIGLYQQFIGRGVRKSDGKTECHVYDLSGTYDRLGKAVEIRLANNNGEFDLISGSGKFWHDTETAKVRIKARY